jgi:hypothetical protein
MEDKGWKEKVETDAHKVSVSQNLEIKFPLKGKKKLTNFWLCTVSHGKPFN